MVGLLEGISSGFDFASSGFGASSPPNFFMCFSIAANLPSREGDFDSSDCASTSLASPSLLFSALTADACSAFASPFFSSLPSSPPPYFFSSLTSVPSDFFSSSIASPSDLTAPLLFTSSDFFSSLAFSPFASNMTASGFSLAPSLSALSSSGLAPCSGLDEDSPPFSSFFFSPFASIFLAAPFPPASPFSLATASSGLASSASPSSFGSSLTTDAAFDSTFPSASPDEFLSPAAGFASESTPSFGSLEVSDDSTFTGALVASPSFFSSNSSIFTVDSPDEPDLRTLIPCFSLYSIISLGTTIFSGDWPSQLRYATMKLSFIRLIVSPSRCIT
mmetsp:Transcript_1209/g.1903  ORF Transcript_1209/g.1903 Transcript_1209/m.1903 type:complete len:333 (-) Transcript_1209:3629-4627(-)